MHGYFKNGNPHISADIYGHTKELKNTFECMVDTGFNGFVTIPYLEAFPLGLIMIGTTSSTIADGSTSSSLMCQGTVVIDGQELKDIPITIMPNCNILFGTQLLKRAGLKMNIDFESETMELISLKKSSKKKK